MFCFQCEQTIGCKGYTGSAGACGKKADIAQLQDKLTGALIGLARATEGNESLITPTTDQLILEGLFSTITNVNCNDETIHALLARIDEEKRRLVPNCYSCVSVCGRNNDYDMQELWTAEEDIRSLKSLILFAIRGMAAYAYHAAVLGYTDNEVTRFFYKALIVTGLDLELTDLLPIVMEVGKINLKCMALLDKVNGNPVHDESLLIS